MTIDKAIEELQNWNSATFETRFVSFSAALNLGIEALKRCKRFRDNSRTWGYKPLPGETEEVK